MVRPLAIALLFLAQAAFADGIASCDDLKRAPPEYYTLALSWHPTLCMRVPADHPECATDADARAATLVLHGLWPERRGDERHCYAFCGVEEALQKKDVPDAWGSLPVVPMRDDDIKGTLYGIMPGWRVGLDRHEWIRHGTCSGLDADMYFGAAVVQAQLFLQSEFARFLRENAGRPVRREDVLAEFERRYGEGSRASVSLWCKKVGAADYFSEVSVYLAAPLRGEPALAKRESYQTGNCPAEFEIPFPKP